MHNRSTGTVYRDFAKKPAGQASNLLSRQVLELARQLALLTRLLAGRPSTRETSE